MAELTEKDLDLVQRRVVENYPARTIVSEVFTSENSKQAFLTCLNLLADKGARIQVGGRSLRKQVGLTTFDFANVVIKDSHDIRLNLIEAMRLKPFLKIYDSFPSSRMTKPDLDFFIWGITSDEIIETFRVKGFKVSKHEATGGVWVIEIQDDDMNGSATFVDGAMSWQTKDEWPMLGFKADFIKGSTPTFNLDISAARLYVYPLSIAGIHNLDPLDPRRVAAIGRALLWAVTVGVKNTEPLTHVKLTADSGYRVRPPLGNMQSEYFVTVYLLGKLLKDIEQKPEIEYLYRSGIRDMALALRIIAFLDDEHELRAHNYSPEMSHFLLEINRNYYDGKAQFYDSNEC